MEVVSLEPLSRATLTAHLRPKFTRCYSKTPKPSHLPVNSLDSSTGRFRAGPIASGASPFHPLCLILHSFGGFVFSRLPKAQSWLHGGLPDGCKRQRGSFLCCGGIGTFLMSTTSAATKDRVSPFLWTLAGNPTFMSGLVAWSLAQTIKMLLNFFFERRWDIGVLFSSGGMPSSHSALCTALTASVALCHGVGDSLFPVCLGFSLIVMYDAIGVRRHAGMQAEVLNKIIEDLFQAHPISKRKLKELLGHTPSQVFAGAVLGILVACVCCPGYILPI